MTVSDSPARSRTGRLPFARGLAVAPAVALVRGLALAFARGLAVAPAVALVRGLALALVLAIPLALVACSALPAGRAPLHVANGTTLDVTLVVNGTPVATFGPGEGTPEDGLAGDLPPLPWTVVATTSRGRVLATMTVSSGDVREATAGDARTSSGRMARVDLSCGRLDIWAGGMPPLGPAPGPGVPGDCVP